MHEFRYNHMRSVAEATTANQINVHNALSTCMSITAGKWCPLSPSCSLFTTHSPLTCLIFKVNRLNSWTVYATQSHTHTQGSQYMRSGDLDSRPDYSCRTQNICKSNANCWRHNHRTANWQRGIDSIFILANFMLNMPPFAFNSW